MLVTSNSSSAVEYNCDGRGLVLLSIKGLLKAIEFVLKAGTNAFPEDARIAHTKSEAEAGVLLFILFVYNSLFETWRFECAR